MENPVSERGGGAFMRDCSVRWGTSKAWAWLWPAWLCMAWQAMAFLFGIHLRQDSLSDIDLHQGSGPTRRKALGHDWSTPFSLSLFLLSPSKRRKKKEERSLIHDNHSHFSMDRLVKNRRWGNWNHSDEVQYHEKGNIMLRRFSEVRTTRSRGSQRAIPRGAHAPRFHSEE